LQEPVSDGKKKRPGNVGGNWTLVVEKDGHTERRKGKKTQGEGSTKHFWKKGGGKKGH